MKTSVPVHVRIILLVASAAAALKSGYNKLVDLELNRITKQRDALRVTRAVAFNACCDELAAAEDTYSERKKRALNKNKNAVNRLLSKEDEHITIAALLLQGGTP